MLTTGSATRLRLLLKVALLQAPHQRRGRRSNISPPAAGRYPQTPLPPLAPGAPLLLSLVGFGWGKPVPVNPNATRNPKASLAITAITGPVSNFVIAAGARLQMRISGVA